MFGMTGRVDYRWTEGNCGNSYVLKLSSKDCRAAQTTAWQHASVRMPASAHPSAGKPAYGVKREFVNPWQVKVFQKMD
jgi:hypothetical protein